MPYSTQLHSCKDHSSTLLASCGAGTVASQSYHVELLRYKDQSRPPWTLQESRQERKKR